MSRPETTEYGAHYQEYIAKVPDGDIRELLRTQLKTTIGLLDSLTEEQALFRYAEGKWSLKEVVGHVADTERVMSYRLLCIARGDQTPFPSMDEHQYVASANFDDLPLSFLLEEFTAVRQATLSLLAGLRPEAWLRQGTAAGCNTSVRGLAYIIAGHELHHVRVIQERYLAAQP
ncbi:DinB family protein [Paenibacillus ehimensis]|uniref:DinB family protein n=1 Tax=Paenibacillus ehimensis TaxID=79264 RepID=A0ABT8VJJ5_9BACL|nr:DinB family protein [Paenibacillus ehimensis]MDO3681169.1 DinB family protein [Paenibacillus ehimensis]MEC0212533.1 DinB family protein [Paenibacillus ehimensis]